MSYTTLKKQYDAIRRISSTQVAPISKPITTSNRFVSLAEQTDIIKIINIVKTIPSIITYSKF